MWSKPLSSTPSPLPLPRGRCRWEEENSFRREEEARVEEGKVEEEAKEEESKGTEVAVGSQNPESLRGHLQQWS